MIIRFIANIATKVRLFYVITKELLAFFRKPTSPPLPLRVLRKPTSPPLTLRDLRKPTSPPLTLSFF